jgi:hypothetical protein
MKLPFFTAQGRGKMGGISISHTGQPGGVIAYGMLAKKSVGFSSHFRFTDPSQRLSNTLVGAHLQVEGADLPGFSARTVFTAIAVLRNIDDSPVEVSPAFTFDETAECER